VDALAMLKLTGARPDASGTTPSTGLLQAFHSWMPPLAEELQKKSSPGKSCFHWKIV
jgi:hypothetical protein